MSNSTPREAGWYLSRFSPESERYWDGHSWTDNFRPTFGISKAPEASDEPELLATAKSDETQGTDLNSDLWERAHASTPGAPPTPMASAPASPAPSSPQSDSGGALAIVGIVTSFLFGPLGIIFGHLSLNRARSAGESTSLSVISIVIGWITTLFGFVIFALFFMVLAFSSSATYMDDGGRVDMDPPIFDYPDELEMHGDDFPFDEQ